MIDPVPVKPRLPQLAELDPRQVSVSYDYASDTLIVDFIRPRGAYSDPVGDHLYLRIDPVTEDIVGVQIEHFLLCVVREHPMFLELAALAGVPEDELAAIRSSLPQEIRQAAALDTVFAQLAALSYSPEELADDRIDWSPPVLTAPAP